MDMPPIPPAVVEFAEKNGFEDIAVNKSWNPPIRTYKGYKVYSVKKIGTDDYYDFILYNDKETRLPSVEEGKEIINGLLYL